MSYKKVYCKAFNYPMHQDTFIPSELSGNRAIDLHHIVDRSDRIENLMALTREEHDQFGDKKEYMVMLLKTHRQVLIDRRIPFSVFWFIKWIKHYENIA